MIERIIEFSARNRLLVLVFTAVAVAAAVWTVRRIPLDAIPDLSDTQVIVFSRWDRSPDIIEDQVTYPVVTALLGASVDTGVLPPMVHGMMAYGAIACNVAAIKIEIDALSASSRVVDEVNRLLGA